MAGRLRDMGHEVLCTSRRYGEASRLAKIRGFEMVYVGRHGGRDKKGKLDASTQRIRMLSGMIDGFGPDVAVSFCSPEAARVAFGLGIRHIAFYDGPHADAMLRLTVPLVQKLLIPGIIPKGQFARYGIDKSDIITYDAIDAGITIRRQASRTGVRNPFGNNGRKNIIIRTVEEEASYAESLRQQEADIAVPITEQITERYGKQNIVVLCRYAGQAGRLRSMIGNRARVTRMAHDGKYLLENADVFIGSGGTMTAESALMGVHTVSYNAVPNVVEEYLVKKGLVRRLEDPNEIVEHVGNVLGLQGGRGGASSDDKGRRLAEAQRRRAAALAGRMEDPADVLIRQIEG